MKVFAAIAILFISVYSSGQTVVVPDADFRQCLIDQYPTLLDGSNELITAQAQSFTGTLSCTNSNIVDLSTLENFTSAQGLNFGNNEIVDASAISGLSQLTSINFTNNELEVIPDLSGFSGLDYLNFSYNQMDNPPVLSAALDELYMTNNSLAGTIDVSNLTQLRVLHAAENDIASLTGLSNLVLLEEIDLHTNELSENTDLTAFTVIKSVNLADNDFVDIPQFDVVSLQWLSMGSNDLSFDDYLLYTPSVFFPDSFPDFQVQRVKEDSLGDEVNEGDSWTWSLSFDQGVVSNTYYWYRENVLFDSTNTGVLTISNVELADSGKYRCEVVNSDSKLQGVRIVTNPHVLIVNEDTSTVLPPFVINDSDPPSFSPNGDGNEDTYYIEYSGNAQVFDHRGKLVDRFTAPHKWDGIGTDNQLLDIGYYLIVVGDQRIGVTLLR